MGSRTGQCDCCGADNVELSFSVSYGLETWSCSDGCDISTEKAAEAAEALVKHSEWASWANDPAAKAVVDNWLSGFGDPPVQLTQLQKDWLVIGIAEAIRIAVRNALPPEHARIDYTP